MNFQFEMTDTFGGELNYCWLYRFEVTAKNLKGALIKVSRETGYKFRFDGINYSAKNACVALYECFEVESDMDWIEKAKKL